MAANAQKNKFLIDGFPRNQDNLQGWNKTMDGKADISFVLFFDCNNEICIEQCLERGKSSGRSDDNRGSLEKRIQTYLQSTKPIIDLYEEMGKVRKIDASKSVDEVSTPSLPKSKVKCDFGRGGKQYAGEKEIQCYDRLFCFSEHWRLKEMLSFFFFF